LGESLRISTLGCRDDWRNQLRVPSRSADGLVEGPLVNHLVGIFRGDRNAPSLDSRSPTATPPAQRQLTFRRPHVPHVSISTQSGVHSRKPGVPDSRDYERSAPARRSALTASRPGEWAEAWLTHWERDAHHEARAAKKFRLRRHESARRAPRRPSTRARASSSDHAASASRSARLTAHVSDARDFLFVVER
jgi:hypothetical protein